MKLSFTFQAIDTYTKEEAAMNTLQWLKNMKARNVRVEWCVVKCNASESLADKIYAIIIEHGQFRGVRQMIQNGEAVWQSQEMNEEDENVYLRIQVSSPNYRKRIESFVQKCGGSVIKQLDYLYVFSFKDSADLDKTMSAMVNQKFFCAVTTLSDYDHTFWTRPVVDDEYVQDVLPSDIDSRDYPIRSEDDEKEYHECYDVYAEHAGNEPVEMSETDVDMLLASCIPCLLENWDNTDAHNTMNVHGYPVTRRVTPTYITLYIWHNQKIIKKLEFPRVVSSENAFQQ